MGIDLHAECGTDLDDQEFTWRDLVGAPLSKLDNDAFTRVRVLSMHAIEAEQHRFLHALARGHRSLRLPVARIRRIEQHQQTLLNWLTPPDQSPLETTIALEQVAIEVTASIAQAEPDPRLAQVYRFGVLESFDHMFRFSALMDRIEGRDANDMLQSYTDIMPGRPTSQEHRAPVDDLREPYDREDVELSSRLHVLTVLAGAHVRRDHAMAVGPMFPDPIARQLFAEIASIGEQHVTQYESLLDPDESPLEQWVLHELNEVYGYHACLVCEDDPRIKPVWERFVDYELGQLHFVMDLMRKHEKRDPAELVPASLPDPLPYRSAREFVRKVLAAEVAFTANGTRIGPLSDSVDTLSYRRQLNAHGSPADAIAAGWHWHPGTELTREALDIDGMHKMARESA